MDEIKTVNSKIGFTKDEFKKVFRHLCLASKTIEKDSRKEKDRIILEDKLIKEKIHTVEVKDSENNHGWIKDKLDHSSNQLNIKNDNTVIVISNKKDNKSEIDELKKQINNVKQKYNLLKNKKNVNLESLSKLKDRISSLEKLLSKFNT